MCEGGPGLHLWEGMWEGVVIVVVVVVGACMRLCHIFFIIRGKRRVRGCEGNTQPQRRPGYANPGLPAPDRSTGRPLPAQTPGQNGRQGWAVEISRGRKSVCAGHSLSLAPIRSLPLPPCHNTTAAIGRSRLVHSGEQRVWTDYIYVHTYTIYTCIYKYIYTQLNS